MKSETLQEYLARGGTIKRIPPGTSYSTWAKENGIKMAAPTKKAGSFQRKPKKATKKSKKA